MDTDLKPLSYQGHVIDSLARDFYFRHAINVRACAMKLSHTAEESAQNVVVPSLRVRGRTVELDGVRGLLLRLSSVWTFTALQGKERKRDESQKV